MAGRKKIEIDIEQAVTLAETGLSVRQIAARLGVPKSTLADRCKEVEALETAFELGRAKAAEELGRILWEQARNGSVIAAIYLTKSLLNWRDSGPPQGEPESHEQTLRIYIPRNQREEPKPAVA